MWQWHRIHIKGIRGNSRGIRIPNKNIIPILSQRTRIQRTTYSHMKRVRRNKENPERSTNKSLPLPILRDSTSLELNPENISEHIFDKHQNKQDTKAKQTFRRSLSQWGKTTLFNKQTTTIPNYWQIYKSNYHRMLDKINKMGKNILLPRSLDKKKKIEESRTSRESFREVLFSSLLFVT